MIDFVTGRGRRTHMRTGGLTACGVEWDQIVPRSAVDKDDMCHNCLATAAWREAGGLRLFPPTTAEPQTAPVVGDAGFGS